MYFNEKRQGLAPFVNLRSDVGFKAVFADKNNKDILIGVLNMILPSEARIDDITEYSDREQRRDVPYGKKTVLDLVCRDKSGRTFVVEMQAAEEDNFFERCVYYASGLYHLELSDGERYKGLRPVYVVSFLNYRRRCSTWSVWTRTTGRSSSRCRQRKRTTSSKGASITHQDSITWSCRTGNGTRGCVLSMWCRS
ncbi:putative uncharacterized protein [Alistipes sp. CAG:435]|nr:putative uncharacterized protein [Alistipes sp. CAG:435]